VLVIGGVAWILVLSTLNSQYQSSQVIHDLAVRGAAALEEDHDAQERARNFLVSVADGTSGLDLEALRTVRDRAWR